MSSRNKLKNTNFSNTNEDHFVKNDLLNLQLNKSSFLSQFLKILKLAQVNIFVP